MPPIEKHNFQHRKLPEESALREYLDSYISKGPGDLPSTYLEDDMSAKMPALLWQDEGLTPQIIPPGENERDFNIESYVPPAMAEKIRRSNGRAVLVHDWNINMGGYIHGIYREVNDFYSTCRTHQIDIFAGELDKKGYIARRTHEELKAEIARRKVQYPNQPIYIFTGERIQDFYEELYGGPVLDQAQIVCVGSDYRYRSYYRYRQSHDEPNEKKFDDYNTAVIAHNQIKANHSYDVVYNLERITRAWKIKLTMLHKFVVDVPVNIIEAKKLKDPGDARFDLEL